MRDTGTDLKALVVAAQGGDRRAIDELVSAHLPLVYTIVRRALGDHTDTDDVVQEAVVRAVRELRELREPESFRAWLAAIAVRQVSTSLRQRRRAARQTAPLDDVIASADSAAAFEGLTVLRLELSARRGELVRASRWLDIDDRALLSAWWLEVAGRLTRAELAEAFRVNVAHAGVRVQRMRAQLDLSRTVVAALEARPRCPELDAVTAQWDGLPSPKWRKRIARHVRLCPQCASASGEVIAPERLLAGAMLIPVPAALTATVMGKASSSAAAVTAGTAAKVSVFGELARAVAAHPVAAACLAGTLVAGAIAATATGPGSGVNARGAAPARGTQAIATASPTPPAATLAPGPVSLEAANRAGFMVSTTNSFGYVVPVGAGSDAGSRQRATFEVVAGLADPACFSLRLPDGTYLRHSSWRLRVFRDDGTPLFRGDATFCARPGLIGGSISLEASNYPGWFLRHRGDELWVDQLDGTSGFAADSSFRVRTALGG